MFISFLKHQRPWQIMNGWDDHERNFSILADVGFLLPNCSRRLGLLTKTKSHLQFGSPWWIEFSHKKSSVMEIYLVRSEKCKFYQNVFCYDKRKLNRGLKVILVESYLDKPINCFPIWHDESLRWYSNLDKGFYLEFMLYSKFYFGAKSMLSDYKLSFSLIVE